jgi:DNA-directed RNA polymerase specialized sigma24 family protein
VSLSAFARNRSPRTWISGWVICLLLTGCSRQKTEAEPDPIKELQAIAPADPAKFPVLEGGKHWSNPYLVVRPQTVGLLTDVAANQEQILKAGEVLKALAQLPPAAWPYGRAVAILVEMKGTSSEQEKIELRRNRGIVAGELQSAHITIHWIPPS